MLDLKRRSSAAPCTCNRRLTEFPPAHPFAKTAKGLGTLDDECHILRPERVRHPPTPHRRQEGFVADNKNVKLKQSRATKVQSNVG
jgi:hypothetical protein